MSLPTAIELNRAFSDPVYFAENILNVHDIYPYWKNVLREFYSRDEEGNVKYRELVACVGMGSGKTYTAAIITLFEFFQLIMFDSPQEHYNLSKASPIYIVNCAKSEAQAKSTVFGAAKNFILDSPFFLDLIKRGKIKQRHNEFEHVDKRVFLKSEHSHSGSLAGKNSKCVVFDELAKLDFTASGESAADEVYAIVTKATGRFGVDGKIVSISSPISTNDKFYSLVEKGKKNPNLKMLVIHKPTWDVVDLNVKPEYAFDSDMMIAEREKDYDKFMRDYGAQPMGRVRPFFPDVKPIKDCEENRENPIELDNDGDPTLADWFKPKDYIYVVAGDPALKRDAFGLAMGHLEGENIVVDFVTKFQRLGEEKEIDVKKVREFVMSLLDRGFNILMFVTDIKSYPELFQDLEFRGVEVKQSFVKKETYDYLKERMNLNEILYPKNPDLVDELRHLELMSARKVDHPKYGSKDMADALANVAFFVKDADIEPPKWVFVDKW